MPEGVEHNPDLARTVGVKLVIVPLMPEGVEHTEPGFRPSALLNVIVPLMPEGVEHWCGARLRSRTRPGDRSFDAGRR